MNKDVSAHQSRGKKRVNIVAQVRETYEASRKRVKQLSYALMGI